MRTRTPIEKTIRYATGVDELSEAWAFVMEHLESVGPDPSISISPMWVIGDSDETNRRFEVAVSGMVEA